MISRVLYPDTVGCVDPAICEEVCGNPVSCSNTASTLFTMDIYKEIRASASTKELLIVGRVFLLVLVAVSITWIPIIQTMQGGQLFIYIQAISAYLSPPIAIVYLM